MSKRISKAKREAWTRYEQTMLDAKAAALALADALERYARRCQGFPGEYFQAACQAADEYQAATRKAQPYHFGCLPHFNSGWVVNSEAEDLLSAIRELRGSAVPVSVRAWTWPMVRTAVAYRYERDGVAGFYDVELASMRPFGSSRRDPLAA